MNTTLSSVLRKSNLCATSVLTQYAEMFPGEDLDLNRLTETVRDVFGEQSSDTFMENYLATALSMPW